VEQEPVPLTLWTALTVPPRPSFVLRVPLRQERPQPQAKLVRQPLKIQSSPIVGFHGLLLGPEDMPLSDCRVEMPDLNLATHRLQGRFSFPSVPAAGTKQLLVKEKDNELQSAVKRTPRTAGHRLDIIRFSPLEG